MPRRNAGDNNQLKRFVEFARALDCDESEERFDAALKKVATHKLKGEPSPPAKRPTERARKP